MSHESFTLQNRAVGRAAVWSVFFLGVLYAVTTVLGFLSLKSPRDPIGDSFFSIMHHPYGAIDGHWHGRSSRLCFS
jgi:hypothetical protein